MHPLWKDIHQMHCAPFLVSLSYYLYGAVRGAVELTTLYLEGLHGADHLNDEKWGGEQLTSTFSSSSLQDLKLAV